MAGERILGRVILAAGDDPYFGIAAVVVGVIVVGVLLLLGRYYPGSGAQQLDWKPTRSYEQEIQLELDDVDQMLEAQNKRRRARGEGDRTEDDVQAQLDSDRRELQARSERYRNEDGSPGS